MLEPKLVGSVASAAPAAKVCDPVIAGYETLLHKTEFTKGSRFQAARRHDRRSRASILSIISLSMYVFFITVFVCLEGQELQKPFVEALNLVVISMSAFIIAFSVLEHGKKHDLKAELFLRNAQGVARIHDEAHLDLDLGRCNAERLQSHHDGYAKLVHDFADNHSEADYRTFRNRTFKPRRLLSTIWNNFVYLVDCWSLAWLSFVVPMIVLIVLYIYLVEKVR